MNSSSFRRNNIDTNPTTLNMNLNAFPDDHITFDPDPNYHPSSSLSCRDFFNYYDPGGFFHPQHQPDNANYDNYNDGGYNTIPNNIANNLGLSLWQKDEHGQIQSTTPEKAPNNPKKMKNPADRVALTTPMDRKPASSPETDQFSSSSSNAQSPIRVCSDCNTTKTPLWRSGPKGPKSLCNACGIRQRKARRAMAASAGNGMNQMTSAKLQQRKEKPGRSSSGPPLQIKKRCRTTSTTAATKLSIVNGEKKACFEDVLINLSKKLAVVHRVFPEEEKDAAILLMALSYGLVHG